MDNESRPSVFFAEQGYDVVIEERDLHAERIAAGDPGRASFYREHTEYFCVQLVQDGKVVWPDVGIGETVESALAAAQRWFMR